MLNRRHHPNFQEKGPSWDAQSLRSEVERVNDERTALLIRQFDGRNFTAADQQRLDALTAKMVELVPGITPEDLEEVKTIERRLDDFERTLLQVRRKYERESPGIYPEAV